MRRGKKPMLKDKNAYDKMLHEYERRIRNHVNAVTRLRKKCRILRKSIKRQEDRNNKLHEINKYVRHFTGYSVQNLGGFTGNNRELNFAKNLFYKYCLENGIQGNFVAKFCGMKTTETVSKRRLVFTRSFKTNSYNKEQYHLFLEFIKNNPN